MGKFAEKIYLVNVLTAKTPNLPSKIYLCRMNTLLNKMRIFANIEYKQLLIRGYKSVKI